MANDNLSGEPEPVAMPANSFDEAVGGLSKLLSDPAATPDPDQGGEDHEQAASEDAEAEGTAKTADPDARDEFAEAEDVEGSEAEAKDGSDAEIKGGQFAPASAKFKLEDGSVITIGELARNNLFQRDYTRKTTEHAEAVKAFEARKAEVDQFAQEMGQVRDYVAWYAEQFLPKAPGEAPNPAEDPVGYQQWQFERDRYAQHVQAYNVAQALRQQESQKAQAKLVEEHKSRLTAEAQALTKLYPFLSDPAKKQRFWSDTEAGAAEFYGVPANEVQAIADHRYVRILRDAIAYRRIKASAPKAKDDARRPPAPPNGGKRGDPGANARRDQDALSEQLRKTGSFNVGVAKLKSLIS